MNKYAYLITLFLTSNLSAQQEPVYTQYWNNYMNSNPAMAGAVYKHAASALWKDFWFKNENSNLPYQTTVSANYAIRLDSIRSGVGISYRYDALAFVQTQTCLATFAHHIPIGNTTLSVGASAGVKVLKNDAFGYVFVSQPEPIPNKVTNNPQFTADFGVAVRHEKWNAGISVTQLYPSAFRFEATNTTYDLAAHYWLFGDYTFDLGSKWKLTPRVQLTTDAVKLTDNVGVTATTADGKLWFGVQARNLLTKDSYLWISPVVGYDFKEKYRVGYAMNIGSEPDPLMHNHITHELNLSFLLK